LLADHREALDWLRKAAEKRHAGAQYLLAKLYLEGRGVPVDKARAFAWLNVSSLRGNDEAEAARKRLGSDLSKIDVEKAQEIGAQLPDPVFRIANELAELPKGLDVTHEPNPVLAQAGGRSGNRYTWEHTTTVSTIGVPVIIEEFGAFNWRNGRWVFGTFTGEPFTKENFADWYACRDAEIRPASACSDKNNWWGDNELKSQRGRWYFIGVRASGERVKGEAELRTLGELRP